MWVCWKKKCKNRFDSHWEDFVGECLFRYDIVSVLTKRVFLWEEWRLAMKWISRASFVIFNIDGCKIWAISTWVDVYKHIYTDSVNQSCTYTVSILTSFLTGWVHLGVCVRLVYCYCSRAWWSRPPPPLLLCALLVCLLMSEGREKKRNVFFLSYSSLLDVKFEYRAIFFFWTFIVQCREMEKRRGERERKKECSQVEGATSFTVASTSTAQGRQWPVTG